MQTDRPRKYSLSFSFLSIWSKPPLPLCGQLHPEPPNVSFAFNFCHPPIHWLKLNITACTSVSIQPNTYNPTVIYWAFGTWQALLQNLRMNLAYTIPDFPTLAQFCVFHNSTCYGLNSAPPSNSCAELLTPQDFEDRALKNVVKVKWGHKREPWSY